MNTGYTFETPLLVALPAPTPEDEDADIEAQVLVTYYTEDVPALIRADPDDSHPPEYGELEWRLVVPNTDTEIPTPTEEGLVSEIEAAIYERIAQEKQDSLYDLYDDFTPPDYYSSDYAW